MHSGSPRFSSIVCKSLRETAGVQQPSLEVLVYNGEGAGYNSARNTLQALERCLAPGIEARFLGTSELLEGTWRDRCLLLVMPGGADLPYCKHLNGRGNSLLRGYVEHGGSYLGICAGAYYACSRVEFEPGTDLEVVGDRELGFFPGTARGAAYPGFDYASERGACAAPLRFRLPGRSEGEVPAVETAEAGCTPPRLRREHLALEEKEANTQGDPGSGEGNQAAPSGQGTTAAAAATTTAVSTAPAAAAAAATTTAPATAVATVATSDAGSLESHEEGQSSSREGAQSPASGTQRERRAAAPAACGSNGKGSGQEGHSGGDTVERGAWGSRGHDGASSEGQGVSGWVYCRDYSNGGPVFVPASTSELRADAAAPAVSCKGVPGGSQQLDGCQEDGRGGLSEGLGRSRDGGSPGYEVLAVYPGLGDALAAVRCRVGLGVAVLCGTHPEMPYEALLAPTLSYDALQAQHVAALGAELELWERQRKQLWAVLLLACCSVASMSTEYRGATEVQNGRVTEFVRVATSSALVKDGALV